MIKITTIINTYWKCQKYKSLQCLASVVNQFENDSFILEKEKRESNHIPDASKRQVLRAIQNIREKAVDTLKRPSRTIRQEKRKIGSIS